MSVGGQLQGAKLVDLLDRKDRRFVFEKLGVQQ